MSDSYKHMVQKLSLGALVIFVGLAIGHLIRLFINLCIAKATDPSDFGAYAIGLTLLDFSVLLTALGLGHGIVRYVAIYDSQKEFGKLRGVVWFSLCIACIASVCMAGLLYIGRFGIADMLFSGADDNAIFVISVFSVCIPLLVVLRLTMNVFRGFKIAKYETIIFGILRPLTKLVILLLLLYFGLKLKAAVYSHLISVCVCVAIGVALVLRYLSRAAKTESIGTEKKFNHFYVLAFSFPLLLNALIHKGVNHFDILMLGFFKQASAAGIFFLSAKIGIIVGYFLESANYIFAPVISDLHRQDRLEDVQKLYKALNRVLIGLTIPLCFFVMLYAKEILGFFGSDYGSGVWIVYLVSVCQVVRVSTGSSGYILVMTGEQKLVFRITVITALLHLVLNLILIPKYGATGAAISLSTSLILSNLLALYEVKRIHDITPFSRGLVKVGVGAVLVLLTMICMKFVLSLDVMSSIFAICAYVGFLYVLYLVILISLGLEQEERLVIGRVIGRFRKDNYGKQKV